MFNKDIVKSRLKHVLGLNTDVIYARKCEIKNVDKVLCDEFLKHHHTQGSIKTFNVGVGLFYNSELVSIMTFGKNRLALGNNKTMIGEYEMYRYATSKTIVGGASKLLSYFIKTYKPTKIISYADRRWSEGNLYEKLGFIKKSNGVPNYWYFKPGYFNRYHRFNFRKDQLQKKLEVFDPMLTEWENMQNNGWDRIWDCGNLKYELVCI
jgi:hypothetical protein